MIISCRVKWSLASEWYDMYFVYPKKTITIVLKYFNINNKKRVKFSKYPTGKQTNPDPLNQF